MNSTPRKPAFSGQKTVTDGAFFTVELRVEGDGPPAEIRLRRLLKSALRTYGLRATSVATASKGDQTTNVASNGSDAAQGEP
ncbi:MAG: hypothetical protein H7144_04915 [Burkholderiales bacterium]|nr:hypothetical protein [Phycisphaerae bacterium]